MLQRSMIDVLDSIDTSLQRIADVLEWHQGMAREAKAQAGLEQRRYKQQEYQSICGALAEAKSALEYWHRERLNNHDLAQDQHIEQRIAVHRERVDMLETTLKQFAEQHPQLYEELSSGS
jgi:5-bromo-4-chloroindolyl phosphate hydrolysis protein